VAQEFPDKEAKIFERVPKYFQAIQYICSVSSIWEGSRGMLLFEF
jgi:hypothetical protein